MRAATRRWRAPVLIGVALVATAVVATLAGGDQGRSAALDPGNAGPSGARAVAQVLGDQGVEVAVARSADELEDEELGPDTTVVVTSADDLGQSTVRRLRQVVPASRLLVVEPPPLVLAELDEALESTRVLADDPVPADCPERLLRGLTVQVDVASSVSGSGRTCFDTEDGGLFVRTADGIGVLGAGAALSNDQVTRAGNAALALRLLGQRERLVWYVPDPADQQTGDSVSLRALLPPWIGSALGLLAVTLVLVLLWRGRRLGPLLVEPLPVRVRAIESTHGRGQLYRKSGSREHAATVLRNATAARLAAHGLTPAEIHSLLAPYSGAPANDRDLTRLAQALAVLEEQVDPRT